MKLVMPLVACLALPFTAQAGTFPPIPLGLECTVADVIHSNVFPEESATPENLQYMNHCIVRLQTYTRAHCPQSKRTIWQQIEAVAYSGPGIPDKKALLAACN